MEAYNREKIKVKNCIYQSIKKVNEQFGIIKSGGDRAVDWIWRLCNMAFESGDVPED